MKMGVHMTKQNSLLTSVVCIRPYGILELLCAVVFITVTS